MPSVPVARIVRSGLEESVHLGDVAVVDADGRLVAWAGEPERPLFARSSMKPLQAAVSLSLARADFAAEEVAVMCASHNAEPVHVRTVRALLDRAGVSEDALQCPAARPMDDEAFAADPVRRSIYSDCSGKHGGMLSACRAQGWALDRYREPDHPLQQAILRAVLTATGRAEVRVGVDGCGVPVHGMPLASMARIYARLADPDRLGDLAEHARRAVSAMRAHPYLVAGRRRPDTAVMEATGHVVAKGGAEGLICATLLDRGLGMAAKVADGSSRAAGPALVRTLRLLDAIDDGQLEALDRFARPWVLGGGGRVGQISSDFDLTRA
jgi:L-asparaginase II